MRPLAVFVPPKSPGQLEIQALHRFRQRQVTDRTRLVNQIRGLLAEHGVVIARDISRLRRGLSQIAEEAHADDGLTDMIRDLAREIHEELAGLDRRIASCNRRIRAVFRTDKACQRIGKSRASGRSPQPHWWRRSATGAASRTGVSLSPGSDWFRNSDQVAGSLACSASANGVIDTCAR